MSSTALRIGRATTIEGRGLHRGEDVQERRKLALYAPGREDVGHCVKLTGVLLVGGASTRFGSPKALAVFQGETLAERAWRVLGAACDERLAVGKAGLRLPFEVLPDETDVQAPIAGVIAGLRAATHEVSVVLPVDCPLVTPALLRRLGEARAVPQTGPLPGAYAKSDLPELERRLAVGDFSLRGVTERILEVDERLLADVDTQADLAALDEQGT
jgi:molybdenum cofactor guanylyltransferase